MKGTNKNDPGRENPDTPLPVGELGEPPDHLSDCAKELWLEMAPYWGEVYHRHQFEDLCTARADMEHFYAICEDEGWFYVSDKGNKLRHPAAIQFESNRAFANRVASEFGLNPTAKNKIHAPKPARPSPADKFRSKGRT
ncbi:MAG: hypothetical protein GY769_02960 [bacterium]|nr:hypothetical protein [bacterium]